MKSLRDKSVSCISITFFYSLWLYQLPWIKLKITTRPFCFDTTDNSIRQRTLPIITSSIHIQSKIHQQQQQKWPTTFQLWEKENVQRKTTIAQNVIGLMYLGDKCWCDCENVSELLYWNFVYILAVHSLCITYSHCGLIFHVYMHAAHSNV